MLRYVALLLALVLAIGICVLFGGFAGWDWIWILPVSFLGTLLAMLVLLVLTVLLASAVVDTKKEQTKDSKFYRGLTGVLVDVAMWILRVRVHTEGLEQTPKSGRFLLVCNHLDYMDPVTLLAYFKKSQLAFISKRENSSMFVVGKLMHKLLGQLVNRENDREALKTILRCVELIREDLASVAVFPEGYTSLDGLLHPFRHGVFKIAQKTKVPVVVCTLRNTQYVFKNAKRLKPTTVHLHLVGVLQPEQLQGMTAVEIGKQVHAMMAEDLGPDMVLQMEETT